MQMGDSIVLEEEVDPDYEPTAEEVEEYARWLGMDPTADEDLLHIAREGLKAPLPPDWKPCKSAGSEDVYYFNFKTGDSTWDHPSDSYYKRQYEEAKKRKTAAAATAADEGRVKARMAAQELVALQQQREKELTPLPIGAAGRLGLAALPMPSLGLSRPSSGSELSLPTNREAAQRGAAQGNSGRSATAALPSSGIVPLATLDSRIGSAAADRQPAEGPVNAASLSAARHVAAAAAPSAALTAQQDQAAASMTRSFDLRPRPLALGPGPGPALGALPTGASFGKAAALAPLPALGALRSPTTSGAGASSMRSLSAGPPLRKESLAQELEAQAAAQASTGGSRGSLPEPTAVHGVLAPMRMPSAGSVGSDSKSGAGIGELESVMVPPQALAAASRSVSAPASPLPRSASGATVVTASTDKAGEVAQTQPRSNSDAVRDAALARARAQASQIAAPAVAKAALPQPEPEVLPPQAVPVMIGKSIGAPPAAVPTTASLPASGSAFSGQPEGQSPTASSTATAASRKSRERPTSASRTGRSDSSHGASTGGQRGSLTRSTSGMQLPQPLMHASGPGTVSQAGTRSEAAASDDGRGRQRRAQAARTQPLSPSLSESGSGMSGKDDDRSSDELVFRLHGQGVSDASHGYGADGASDGTAPPTLEEGEVMPGFESESGDSASSSASASGSASATASGSAVLRASALWEQARKLQVQLPEKTATITLTCSRTGESFAVAGHSQAQAGAEAEWSEAQARLRGSLPQAAAARRTSQPLSQVASDASLPERHGSESARSRTADSAATPLAETRRLLKQRAAGAYADSSQAGSGSSSSPARIARELQAGAAGKSPVLSISRLQRVASGSFSLHSPGRSRSPGGSAAAAAAASEAAALLASAHADTMAALRQSHAAQLAALEAEAAAHLAARRAALQEEASAATTAALASARRAEAEELRRLREAAEQAATAERTAAAAEQKRIQDEQAAALAALKASQEAELAKARAASAEAVAAEQSRAEAELARLQADHAAELRRALQDRQAAAAAAAAAEDAAAAEARSRHAASVAALEATHTSALAALRQELAAALEQEKTAGEAAVAAARARATADAASAAATRTTAAAAPVAAATATESSADGWCAAAPLASATAVPAPERAPAQPSPSAGESSSSLHAPAGSTAVLSVAPADAVALTASASPPAADAVAVPVVDVVAAVTDLRLNVASLRSQVEACLQHATPSQSQSASASSGIASAAATAGPTPQADVTSHVAAAGAQAAPADSAASGGGHRSRSPAVPATALLLARSVLRFMQLEGGRLAAIQGALRERRLQLAKRRDGLTMQRDAWRGQARRLQAGAVAPMDRRLLMGAPPSTPSAGVQSGAATAGDGVAGTGHTPRASAVELLTAEADKQALRRSKTALDDATAHLNARIAEYKLAEQHAAEMQRRFYQQAPRLSEAAQAGGIERWRGAQRDEVELALALSCCDAECSAHKPTASSTHTDPGLDYSAAAEPVASRARHARSSIGGHHHDVGVASGRLNPPAGSKAAARWRLMSMHDAVAEVVTATARLGSERDTLPAPPVTTQRMDAESARQPEGGATESGSAACSATTAAALLLMKMQQWRDELFGRDTLHPAAAPEAASGASGFAADTTRSSASSNAASGGVAAALATHTSAADSENAPARDALQHEPEPRVGAATQQTATASKSGASYLYQIVPHRLRVWPHEPLLAALHLCPCVVAAPDVQRQPEAAAARASSIDSVKAPEASFASASSSPQPSPPAVAARSQLELVMRDALSAYLHHTGGHGTARAESEADSAGGSSVAGRFWRHDRSAVIKSALCEATARLDDAAAATPASYQHARPPTDTGPGSVSVGLRVPRRASSSVASVASASHASSWSRPERALGLSDMASVATLGTTTTAASHSGRGRRGSALRDRDAGSSVLSVSEANLNHARDVALAEIDDGAQKRFDGEEGDEDEREAGESTGAFEALSPTRFGYDSVSVAGAGPAASAPVPQGGRLAHPPSRPQLRDPDDDSYLEHIGGGDRNWHNHADAHSHGRFDPRARRFSTATGLSVMSRKLVASSPHYPHEPPGTPRGRPSRYRDDHWHAAAETGSHAGWPSRRSSSRSGKRAQGRRVSLSYSAQRSQNSSAASPAGTPASVSSRSAGGRRSAGRSTRRRHHDGVQQREASASRANLKATQSARGSRRESTDSSARHVRPGQTSSALRAEAPPSWPEGMPFPFPFLFPQAWLPSGSGWPYGMGGHGMMVPPPSGYRLGFGGPSSAAAAGFASPFASASMGQPLFMTPAAVPPPRAVPPRHGEAAASGGLRRREPLTADLEPASKREPSWRLQARSMQRQVQSHTAWLQGLAQTMAATSQLRGLRALLPAAAAVTVMRSAARNGAETLFEDDDEDGDAAAAAPISFDSVDAEAGESRPGEASRAIQAQRERERRLGRKSPPRAAERVKAPSERMSPVHAEPAVGTSATTVADAATRPSAAAEAVSGGHGAAGDSGAGRADAAASAAPVPAEAAGISSSPGDADADAYASSSSSSAAARSASASGSLRYESSAFLAAARQRRESERERSIVLQQAVIAGSRPAASASESARFDLLDDGDDADDADSPLEEGARSEDESSGFY